MSLQNLSPACRPDNLRCTKDPAFTHKSVQCHTLRPTAQTAFRHPRNLQIRRRARPSVLIQRTITFSQFFIRCVSLLPFAFFSSSHVSLIAASVSLVAYSSPHLPIPPGPATSAANGQAGLRARPSNASLQPEAGSPYNMSTYSGVSSYASSSARSPMLPYSPYSPASVPPSVWLPHVLWRHERFFRNTGGTGALPWLVCAWQCSRRRWDADTGDSGYVGLQAPGLGTSSFGNFPPTPRLPLSSLAAPPV